MKPQDPNLIRHHPHKAFLMNQKNNELSGPYPRLRKPGAFNRAFAPYRIEIHLSGEADAFLPDKHGVYHTAPGKTVITTETLKPPRDMGELHLMGRNCQAPTTCQAGYWSIPELRGTFENIPTAHA